MIDNTLDPHTIMRDLSVIAEEAGRIINTYIGGTSLPEYRVKSDLSPVTAADEAANTFIVNSLKALKLGLPIIAEESINTSTMPAIDNRSFWLVDPLDGTKEFIAGRDEFTVNIALIKGGTPLIGVIHLPAKNVTYTGHRSTGAFKRQGPQQPSRIRTRKTPPEGPTVVASRSHFNPETKAWLSGRKIAKFSEAGSSLKFCQIAEGAADLYPRLGRTMEWDIAAGHAILSAAGGRVETTTGEPLCYGKPQFENPYFIACGD